jgi:hypothetical protein
MWAARKLLNWSRERLAAQSETTASFVEFYEKEGRVTRIMAHRAPFDALASVRTVLEAAGVTFTNGDEPGVKLRKAD